MLSPQAAIDTASGMYQLTQRKNFGYGMGVGEDKYGNYISHGDSYPGYWAEYIRYIDKDLTIILLSNNSSFALEILPKIIF